MNARLMAEQCDTQLQIRERNSFLGSLSHELRAPLNAIIGFSEMLASGTLAPDSPRREQFAEHIHTSGRHLLRLVNDVLDLSKVDAGDYEFLPEAVDLHDLISGLGDLLHTRIGRKSLQLTVDVAPEVAEVVVDPGGLKRALLNHLSNAVDMASEGSGIGVLARPEPPERFRLEVRVSRPSVACDGGGIQDHPGQRAGSPDLDLTLARRLVEAQGGDMGQFVDPALGTTLYLVLNRFHEPSVSAGGNRATDPLHA